MARSIAAAADPGSGDANPGGLSDDQIVKLRDLLGLTEAADPVVLGAALQALVSKFNADVEEDAADGGADEATEDQPAADTTAADDTASADGEDPAKKKVAASANPTTVTVDRAQWDDMQKFMASARKRDEAARSLAADEMVDAAFAAGKIGRASVAAYKAQAHKDFDGTKSILDTLAASSAFPVGEVGHGLSASAADTTNVREDTKFKDWSL